jgi:hypothetical protein
MGGAPFYRGRREEEEARNGGERRNEQLQWCRYRSGGEEMRLS